MPATPGDRGCSCGKDGIASVVGETVKAKQVRAVPVAGTDGVLKSLGERIGLAQGPVVVIFLRHLG